MTRPVVRLDPSSNVGNPSSDVGCFLVGENTFARGCNIPIKAFLGIPYAQPPVNELRFRSPQKLQLWSGVRDATMFGPACPQEISRVIRMYGQLPNLPTHYDEDCLYLNIWTPHTKPDELLPVMVWIHGGAFVQGFSNIYEGTSLAAYENVVVVSINYRLGVFGFLRTGDRFEDYHGNQGLLDQLESLKWVQRYISCFGGDPNNVTLFGESAGAMSISYHITSPMAQGLFQKAILQSGSCLIPNCVWPNKEVQKFWWRRLHSMGFQGHDCKSVTMFLKGKSTDELLSVFNDGFVPSAMDGMYMTGQPEYIYQTGQFHPVDCIIGFNSSEGVELLPKNIDNKTEAENIIEMHMLGNFHDKPQAVRERMARMAKAEYLITNDYVRDVSDFFGDINFVAPALKQAKFHSGKAQTYIYHFDHRPFFSKKPYWVKAAHGNEIPYMFGYPFLPSIPDIWPEDEKQLSKQLMRYWANFARIGNPNGITDDQNTWHQLTEDSPCYFKIQTTSMKSHNMEDLMPERMHFWNDVVPETIEKYGYISKY